MEQHATLTRDLPRPRPVAARARVHEPNPLWLWALVVVVTIGPLFFLLRSPGGIPSDVRGVGGILWVLSLVPMLIYMATPGARRAPTPAMPLLGVMFGLYYPLQLLLDTPNANDLVSLDPTVDYRPAAEIVLVGWVALLIGYVVMSLVLPRTRPTPLPKWRPVPLKRWAWVLLVGGLALDVARLELPVPAAVRGILQFAGMLSLLGTAILVVLSRRGFLTPTETARLWMLAAAIALIQIGTGSVANFARVGLIVLLAGWIAGAKLRPWIVVAAVALAILVMTLRGFAIDFREQAWAGEDLSQTRRTGLWFSLVVGHSRERGVASTIEHGATVVAARAANLDLLADVIRQTPRSVPFWEGSSYLSLVGAFVPRIFWPDKPVKMLGQEFGHRYGYLDWNDRHTSINFPFTIEFYANFGYTGVLVGMLIVGAILSILGWAVNRPRQDWIRSLCGILVLVPIVTNIESDFSLVFGGLILNGVALYIVYRFLVSRCTSGVARPRPRGVPARMVQAARP